MRHKLILLVAVLTLLLSCAHLPRTGVEWKEGQIISEGVSEGGCPMVISTTKEPGVYLWMCKIHGLLSVLVWEMTADGRTIVIQDCRPNGRVWTLISRGDIRKSCDWIVQNTDQTVSRSTYPNAWKMFDDVRKHFMSLKDKPVVEPGAGPGQEA